METGNWKLEQSNQGDEIMQDETQQPRKKGSDRSEGLGRCGKRSGRDKKGRT